MNTRRRLVVALGAGALTSPLVSFAEQQGKVWRVGSLTQRSRPDSLDSDDYGALPRGMRELGYVEGKNLVIEWRFADNKLDRLPELAAELVRLKVDAIVTWGTPATRAAQKTTPTIPIVMAVGDPVGTGLVKSLARPEGNTTGISNLNLETGPKRFEMLLSMVPKLSRVVVLVNPDNPNGVLLLNQVQAVAQRTSVKVLSADARTPQEIENVFSMMAQKKVGAVIVAQDSFLFQQRRQVAELAVKNRLPSISGYNQYAEAGGLMSYGQNSAEQYGRIATYVDKILKGAKPGDLPVEQPTKFELVVNLKTAKALGIKIPESILVRADRVIE